MFEQLVRACNVFIWQHMYPHRPFGAGSVQHRDLVRVFFAGAMEQLIALDNREAALEYIDEYENMTREGWRPDARFSYHRLP